MGRKKDTKAGGAPWVAVTCSAFCTDCSAFKRPPPGRRGQPLPHSLCTPCGQAGQTSGLQSERLTSLAGGSCWESGATPSPRRRGLASPRGPGGGWAPWRFCGIQGTGPAVRGNLRQEADGQREKSQRRERRTTPGPVQLQISPPPEAHLGQWLGPVATSQPPLPHEEDRQAVLEPNPAGPASSRAQHQGFDSRRGPACFWGAWGTRLVPSTDPSIQEHRCPPWVPEQTPVAAIEGPLE